MAAKRGRSQARRNSGGGGGSLPGWAWMVLGIVLTVGVLLGAPKFLKGDGGDGFFRPKPNPDAQPVATRDEDAGIDAAEPGPPARRPRAVEEPEATQYDFYELLPGEEVALTDAQLAAAARAESERAQREQAAAQAAAAEAARTAASGSTARPQPLPEPGTAAPPERASAAVATATARAPGANETPYVLQAGAFGASGDAEAVKARIALLGLNARVESAQINGKTVYRVRLGPYASASELATAKGKLASGGLPAVAIRAR